MIMPKYCNATKCNQILIIIYPAREKHPSRQLQTCYYIYHAITAATQSCKNGASHLSIDKNTLPAPEMDTFIFTLNGPVGLHQADKVNASRRDRCGGRCCYRWNNWSTRQALGFTDTRQALRPQHSSSFTPSVISPEGGGYKVEFGKHHLEYPAHLIAKIDVNQRSVHVIVALQFNIVTWFPVVTDEWMNYLHIFHSHLAVWHNCLNIYLGNRYLTKLFGDTRLSLTRNKMSWTLRCTHTYTFKSFCSRVKLKPAP